MDTPTLGISPLRQRMLDDLRMCKLNPKKQIAYIRVKLSPSVYGIRCGSDATNVTAP